MIPRQAAGLLRHRLSTAAAVVLLGPRQVGKTTLARGLVEIRPEAVYLDLERPADLRRLEDTDAYLRSQSGRLVILDEVHRLPGLFDVLRGVIDENRRVGHRTGQFLLLGSASLDLMQLTSDSLAGRVSYLDLAGISPDEAAAAGIGQEVLWLRGGFPDSLTALDDPTSLQWRLDLVRSYLERDVPMFAPRLPAQTLGRLWTMLAHTSGGLLNAARLASGLGVSGPTVDRYIDLLSDLGLVRRLLPWHPNVGKRVVKSPKIYVRDTGLLHALLEIESMHHLLGHPVVGPSFESFAVEALITAAPAAWRAHHYRSARGDEVDLVFVRGDQPAVSVEVKRSTAPSVSDGYRRAVVDLGSRQNFVVHPDAGREPYPSGGATVIDLTDLVIRLRRSLRPTGAEFG
jgi:predicted AAA+ superfamily ATPase